MISNSSENMETLETNAKNHLEPETYEDPSLETRLETGTAIGSGTKRSWSMLQPNNDITGHR
jgi:hypothetical protein